MLKEDKNYLKNERQGSHNYTVEIASEIGIDNYYYIYSNLTPGKNKSISKEPDIQPKG